jgi:lactate racemase
MSDGHAAALPFGSGTMHFPLPEGWTVGVADVPVPPPLSVPEATRHALDHPVAGPPLRELARPGMRVTVAVPDLTRPSPDALFVPMLLAELESAGIPAARVTVLVALGMHRPLTDAEIAGRLGPVAASGVRVRQAQGGEPASYRDLGVLGTAEAEGGIPHPVPVFLHEAAAECDLLLATGVVEPHQFAGFSGGRKTAAIGCAGEATIRSLHGIPFLEHPGTRLGSLAGNPLHHALEAIARRARLAFSLNVTFDPHGRPVAVAAGDPRAVLATLAARGAPYFWARVDPEPFDVVLAGVPPAKGSNLYQVSRALTYLAFAPRPVLRDRGWVVLPAELPEGVGTGRGEEEFAARMAAGRDPASVMDHLRREGYGAGGQRAFLVAKALATLRGMVVGARDPEGPRRCHLVPEPDPAAATARLLRELGPRARALVVPNALGGIPLPEGAAIPG